MVVATLFAVGSPRRLQAPSAATQQADKGSPCASSRRWRYEERAGGHDRAGRAARSASAMSCAVDGHRPLDRRRRVLLAARPVGLRQDDDAAADRRVRAADVGRDPARRRRHRAHAAAQAAGQHGVPELRAVPAPHVEDNVAYGLRRQHGSRKAEIASGGSATAIDAGAARRARAAQARAALGRPAAARRARARARARTRRCCSSTSRSARSTRSCARRCSIELTTHAAGGRHHVRLRDARPGRGAHDDRPARGDGQRPGRAGRRRRARCTSEPRTRTSPTSSASRT